MEGATNLDADAEIWGKDSEKSLAAGVRGVLRFLAIRIFFPAQCWSSQKANPREFLIGTTLTGMIPACLAVKMEILVK